MNMPSSPPPKKRGLPWWGILLIVFGILVLLVGLGVGGIVWWVASNKDRIVAEGKQSIAEGESFGASHDQNACVDETIRKGSACDGVMCEAQTKIFAKTCLTRAQKTPGFCDGVPPQGEIMKTSFWLIEECRRRGKPDNQRCSRLLQVVPEACQRPSAQ